MMRQNSRAIMYAAAMILIGGTLAGCAIAADPRNEARGVASKPASVGVIIVLVGDSTVAESGGWGPGFAKLLKPEARCINWARGGRSSKSFINEGWWRKALADKPDYVLIQFGHNDMPGKGLQRETDPKTTYPEYMGRYVDEARAAGARPILVTSLTRRRFQHDGRVHSDLVDYVEAVKKLAKEKKVALIDLHARSIELLDRIGRKASKELEPRSSTTQSAESQPAHPDHTHLSPKGAEVFGRIVADELKKVEPRLTRYFK